MPGPYQAFILMAAWLALRFGELTELRRKDVDLADEVVRVRRAVVRAGRPSTRIAVIRAGAMPTTTARARLAAAVPTAHTVTRRLTPSADRR